MSFFPFWFIHVWAFLSYVSNVKYLAFSTPNTKNTQIRCFKCQNIWHRWTVLSQIWKHIVHELQNFYFFFICWWAQAGVRIFFFFHFLINSSLSPLYSLILHLWSSLSCMPSSLLLHSHSLPHSSSIYTANHKPLPCHQTHLKPPRMELSRLEPPCLELPTSLSLSLSLSACGNWLILVVVGWLILVGGDGFVTMVGCGGGFVTVVGYGGVGCGEGGNELGRRDGELLKWVFYFVFLYIYIVGFFNIFIYYFNV